MKVAILMMLAACFIASRNKSPRPAPSPAGDRNAALAKVPDCDKPEQFLWQLMFGDGNHSTLTKLVAAIIFIAGQIALEILKSR